MDVQSYLNTVAQKILKGRNLSRKDHKILIGKILDELGPRIILAHTRYLIDKKGFKLKDFE